MFVVLTVYVPVDNNRRCYLALGMGKTRSVESRTLSRNVQRAFGKRLSQARARSKPKIAQSVIARALEVSRTSISNIETGRHRVFLDQAYVAARQLGVPLSDLLPGDSEVFGTSPVSYPHSAGFPASDTRLVPYVQEALMKVPKKRTGSRRKAPRSPRT